MSEVQLFRDYPAARGRVPHIPLCDLPTPVERLSLPDFPAAQLYVKRDDISGHRYGGNKVRKLEFLLGDAVAQGARRVLTFGYAGSNFATASAIYANELGMRSYSMLLPQRVEPYVETNLRVSRAAGASLHLRRRTGTVAAAAILKSVQQMLVGRRRPYWIPAGGSSPLGVMGFVNAGLEMIEQAKRGDMPLPDRIYIAMGSMGSAVGLSLALQIRGEASTVVAVRVIGEEHVSKAAFKSLRRRTAAYLKQRVPGMELNTSRESNVEWRDDYFGGAYAEVTDPARDAVDCMTDIAGLPLDTTYSGKAFACLLGDLSEGRCDDQTVLFWNTHNSRELTPWLDQVERDDLPVALRRYLDAGDSIPAADTEIE